VRGLAEVIRADLREFVVGAGMMALHALLEHDRTEICGPRYKHNAERTAHRSGYAQGELAMGGRRVTGAARVRSRGRSRVALPSWQQFESEDPLNDRALETDARRRLDASVRTLAGAAGDGYCVARNEQSAVSRRFIEVTEAQMATWVKRISRRSTWWR